MNPTDLMLFVGTPIMLLLAAAMLYLTLAMDDDL